MRNPLAGLAVPPWCADLAPAEARLAIGASLLGACDGLTADLGWPQMPHGALPLSLPLEAAAEALAGVEIEDGRLVATRSRRRGSGAYYTPDWLVRHVVGIALDGLPDTAEVLDPACGAGAFLRAAARHVGLGRVRGMDRDALAVLAARRALVEAGLPLADAVKQVRLGDGLRAAELAEGFDAVIGNPPWGLTFTGSERVALAADGLLDDGEPCSAAAFLRAATRLARPGGRVALVLPESWLSTRRAAGLRRWLTVEVDLTRLEVYRKGLFAAAPDMVPTVVVVHRRPPTGRTQVRLLGLRAPRPEGLPVTWSVRREVDARAWRDEPEGVFAVAESRELAARARRWRGLCGRLDSVADLHDGVYKSHLMPLLGHEGAPVLVLGRHLTRFRLAEAADLPRVDPGRLSDAERTRQSRPKVLVHALRKPALVPRLVAAADADGAYVASNNFLLVIPHSACPWSVNALAALLNAPLLDHWYAGRFLQVNIEAFTLGSLPLPPFSPAANSILEAHATVETPVAALAAAVDALYPL